MRYLIIRSPRAKSLVGNVSQQQAILGYAVYLQHDGIPSIGYYQPLIRYGNLLKQRDLAYGYKQVIYRDHQVRHDGE